MAKIVERYVTLLDLLNSSSKKDILTTEQLELLESI